MRTSPSLAIPLLMLLLPLHVFAQRTAIDGFELGNPLRIQPSLSGNFGELRPNHFHAGIDLKTGGQEGLDILSIEEGYVSRIKVSPYGYGKVLYIDHPNGYTSVYAHLSAFNSAIDAYLKEQQYLLESFEVDLYPGKGVLPVQKGEVVAFSGNTGGSAGPHLHFEIRETKSEVPRNPLLFNFPINDSKPPVVEAIAVVPLDENSTVNGRNVAFRSRTKGSTIMGQQPIQTVGSVGIQLRGYDSQDGSYNQNGIYRVALYVDDDLVSTFVADSIPFDVSRHLNALIDYDYYYYNKGRYLELYREPGNMLPNLAYHKNGHLRLAAGLHEVRLVASDVHGNERVVSFSIEAVEYVADVSDNAVDSAEEQMIVLHWNLPYLYESSAFKLFFPSGCVYDDVSLSITETEGAIPSIEVGRASTPVQESFVIETKLPEDADPSAGWLIAQINGSGTPFRALNTKNDQGWLKAESRSFGRFKAYQDQTQPTVRSVNFSNGKHWRYGEMKFIIRDNFSGIHDIRVEVDGQWTRFDYEPKQDLVRIDVSDIPSSAERQDFSLIITDLAGNVATFEGNFYKE
jgi:murein DD-endopeptidase MepM/ murein hydrolase activator NlpD